MMRCMQRTNIYLEQQQTVELDRRAAAEGVSRAEMIRRLLDRALHGEDDVASDLIAIDAAFGALVDLDVPERGADAREQHLDALWHTR